MSAYLSLLIYYPLLFDTDMEMTPYPHIIAYMDMDMTPCLHICHFKFIIPY